MSTSTGAPLNLNKFETSDDIVTALTTLYNQNMDTLNSANTGLKTWAPSRVYNKGDIVINKWDDDQIMFALSSHTSSTASTEAAWRDSDSARWASLASSLYMQDPSTNKGLVAGSVVTQNGQIMRARANTYPGKASYMQDMDLLTSRIVPWSPNTHYNVGDYFSVRSPQDMFVSTGTSGAKVTLGNAGRAPAVFVVTTAFTSGSNFPASDNVISNNYQLINHNAYVAIGGDKNNTIAMGFGIYFTPVRNGTTVTLSYWSNQHQGWGDNGGAWVTLTEKVPSVFSPRDLAHVVTYSNRDGGGPHWRIGSDGGMVFWGPKGGMGQNDGWFEGHATYEAAWGFVWPAFTPVN